MDRFSSFTIQLATPYIHMWRERCLMLVPIKGIYNRVLVKFSGEALGRRLRSMAESMDIVPVHSGVSMGFSSSAFDDVAMALQAIRGEGVDVGVVVGGGNIARGAELAKLGMDRVTADYIGMLATIQNGLALKSALEKRGITARVMSAIPVSAICEPYIRGRALRHLEKGRVVIFAGGTGNPLCTTDSAASLRAVEIGAEAVLAGKNGTRGVFDRDPNGPDGESAEFLSELTYDMAIKMGLLFMDQAAMVQLRDHGIKTHIFDMCDPQNFQRVVLGEQMGSMVVPNRGETTPKAEQLEESEYQSRRCIIHGSSCTDGCGGTRGRHLT